MQHEMELWRIYPDGAQEWICPTCGRRVLYEWPPFKRIVLHTGDQQATHGDENEREPYKPQTKVRHESDLTEVWLEAIDKLVAAEETTTEVELSSIWTDALDDLDFSGFSGTP